MGYPAKGTQMLSRNVSNLPSNAANTVSCTAMTDNTLQLTGDGTSPFNTRNCTIGKLEFDPAFNGGKGGLLVQNIHRDSHFQVRTTFFNTTAANTDGVFKIFLAFDKDVPGTGVLISTSPIQIKQSVEQTALHVFFGGGLGAIYPVCNPTLTSSIRTNGFDVTCWENP